MKSSTTCTLVADSLADLYGGTKWFSFELTLWADEVALKDFGIGDDDVIAYTDLSIRNRQGQDTCTCKFMELSAVRSIREVHGRCVAIGWASNQQVGGSKAVLRHNASMNFCNQLRGVHVQSLGDLKNSNQADLGFTIFDPADLGSFNSVISLQIHQFQTKFDPTFAHHVPEHLDNLSFSILSPHRSKVFVDQR